MDINEAKKELDKYTYLVGTKTDGFPSIVKIKIVPMDKSKVKSFLELDKIKGLDAAANILRIDNFDIMIYYKSVAGVLTYERLADYLSKISKRRGIN